MLKKATKKLLEEEIKELKMNLENNYKDLAREAFTALEVTVHTCIEQGELRGKEQTRYVNLVNEYKRRMENYHH